MSLYVVTMHFPFTGTTGAGPSLIQHNNAPVDKNEGYRSIMCQDCCGRTQRACTGPDLKPTKHLSMPNLINSLVTEWANPSHRHTQKYSQKPS